MNPIVVEAKTEKGIDSPKVNLKCLHEMANQADLIVTIGCSGSDFCSGPSLKKILIGRFKILKENRWIKCVK